MKTQIFIILLVTMTFISCEKVIDVDLNEADPKLVIFGTYAHHLNRLFVQVSETASYFNSGTPPSIKDVSIQLENKSGAILASTTGEGARIIYKQVISDASTRLTKVGDVSYREGFEVEIQPSLIPGEVYTLKVTYKGKTYYASSTLFEKVDITQALFVEDELASLGLAAEDNPEPVYNIDVVFLDNVNEKNYYFMKSRMLSNTLKEQVKNDKTVGDKKYPKTLLDPGKADYEHVLVNGQDFYNPVMDVPSINIFNDLNLAGSEYKITLGTSVKKSDINERQDHKIAITEIDFQTYQYLEELENISGGNTPSLAAPGNPNNVWRDASNDQISNVLGYFSCVNYAYRDAVLEN